MRFAAIACTLIAALGALTASAVAASQASFSVAVVCRASAAVAVGSSAQGTIAATGVVHVGANGSAILGVYAPAVRRSLDLDPSTLASSRTDSGSVLVEVRLDVASLGDAAGPGGAPFAAGDLVVVASAT